jgi:hypothetical protein
VTATRNAPIGKVRGRDGKLYPATRPLRTLRVDTALFRRLARGDSARSIAADYGVAPSTVTRFKARMERQAMQAEVEAAEASLEKARLKRSQRRDRDRARRLDPCANPAARPELARQEPARDAPAPEPSSSPEPGRVMGVLRA